MAYLHWKRLNFIQKGQNESRYPQVDIFRHTYLHEKIPKKIPGDPIKNNMEKLNT